jgi:hypothetical protein
LPVIGVHERLGFLVYVNNIDETGTMWLRCICDYYAMEDEMTLRSS